MSISVNNLHEFGPQITTCVADPILDEDGDPLLDESGNNLCPETIIGSYITTAKAIEGQSPTLESYDKNELWVGADSNKITLAGYFRLPAITNQQQAVFMSNGSPFFFSFFKWWTETPGEGDYAFNIFTYGGVGYSDEYAVVTAGQDMHGVNIGDWFAFMFSIDTSPVGDPVRSMWIHKKGDVAGTDLLTGPTFEEFITAGPLDPYICDTSDAIASVGQHPWYVANVFEESMFYMTDEYVNWNDAAVRARFVSNMGKPVDLGIDGSGLTGTQPKIFWRNGDGADNKGTAGNFTEVGTISDSATSPTD